MGLGQIQRGTKQQADPFLAGQEIIPKNSTELPNLLCCCQLSLKLLGKVCAFLPSSGSQPRAMVCCCLELLRVLKWGRLQQQHCSPAGPWQDSWDMPPEFICLLRSKGFSFPHPLKSENQLHRSKKITSLTCINKHMAFKLMITVYFSNFINFLICIYSIIIDYLDYHSLVHYCFKAQS